MNMQAQANTCATHFLDLFQLHELYSIIFHDIVSLGLLKSAGNL